MPLKHWRQAAPWITLPRDESAGARGQFLRKNAGQIPLPRDAAVSAAQGAVSGVCAVFSDGGFLRDVLGGCETGRQGFGGGADQPVQGGPRGRGCDSDGRGAI